MKVKEYKTRARKALSGKYGLVIGVSLVSGLISLIPLIPMLLFILCGIGFAAYHSYGMNMAEGMYGLGAHGLRLSDGMVLGSTALFAILAALCICLVFVFIFLLSIGMQRLYLNISRGAVYRFGDLFYAFRHGSHPLAILGAQLLSVLIALLMILIYGAGIVLAGYFAPTSSATVIYGWSAVWFFLYIYVCYGISQVTTVLIDRPGTRVGKAFSESMRLMKGRRLKYLWMALSFLFWNIPLWLTGGLASLWITPYISCTGMVFYLDAAGEIPREIPEIAEAAAEVPQARVQEEAVRTEKEVPVTPEHMEETPADMSEKTAGIPENTAEHTPENKPEPAPEGNQDNIQSDNE
ncbi:MAG: DUF975 family protein [Eubacteriales bacterium]|nr:DUF975 family protein [Eubacteriales bacterium]